MNKILFRFGSEYLFWSGGFHNVQNLVGDYEIGLLVDEDYQSSESFMSFVENQKSIKVFYAPTLNKFSILSHIRYVAFLKEVLKSFSLDVLIQNDYIEVENMYLFCLSKRMVPRTKCLVRTISRSSSRNTFKLIDFTAQEELKKKIPFFMPINLIFFIKQKIKYYASVIPNQILPLLIGVKSYLRPSSYSNIDNVPYFFSFDGIVTNERFEFEYIKKILPKFMDNIFLCEPAKRLSIEGISLEKKDGILFLPSLLGFIDNYESLDYEIKIFSKYIKLITEKYKIKETYLKLHPSPSRQKINRKIINKVKKYLPDMIILDSSHNTEKLLEDFDYFIGDNSTSLVHATYRQNKVSISLDFKNMPDSDVMKNYEHVNYVKVNEEKVSIEGLDIRKTNYDSYSNGKDFKELLKEIGS